MTRGVNLNAYGYRAPRTSPTRKRSTTSNPICRHVYPSLDNSTCFSTQRTFFAVVEDFTTHRSLINQNIHIPSPTKPPIYSTRCLRISPCKTASLCRHRINRHGTSPELLDYIYTTVCEEIAQTMVTCRKHEGKAYHAPDPAPLPTIRTQQTEPFSVTGVDYVGPLYVRDNNVEIKSYICLFTCAVVRAIHLEVVAGLTERSFLQAFRRFASRKSLPGLMVSDNASTFIAGAEELKHLFQSLSLKEEFIRRGGSLLTSGSLLRNARLGLEAFGKDSLDYPKTPSRRRWEEHS